MSVAAGALHMLDRNILHRKFQHQRQIGAQQVNALAVRPDSNFACIPLRYRTGWRNRRMRDVGAGILPFDSPSVCAGRGCFPGVDNRRFHRLRFQEGRQVVFIGQCFAARPCRALAQGLQRRLGRMLGLADDARKIPITYDGHDTRNGICAILLQFCEHSAGNFRPQHAAMQHSRQHGIVDEALPRKHLVGNVEPPHRVACQRTLLDRFLRDTRRCIAIQRNLAGQLPIARPHIAGAGDGTVFDAERVDGGSQSIRCRREKNMPDLRAGVPQCAAGLLDRQAPRGDALIGARRRRGANHPHAGHVDIEFVGGDLRQRGDDALSDLDLAGRDRHLSVRRKLQPRRQSWIRR